MPPSPAPVRPLLVTFHCGVYFFYVAVFTMSVPHRELQGHFEQMGPDFIRNMTVFMSVLLLGYIGLWNLRRWGLFLLLLAGIPFCIYGFTSGRPILLNFLPLIAAVTSLPLWPLLRRP